MARALQSDPPSAAAAAAAIRAGRLTAQALVEACLERIAAREPALHAWVHCDAEQALAQARALDRLPAVGPLHGVPIGVKDIIDTFDMPTRHGSPIYQDNRPTADAACVALCRAAGMVILGKTVTTEFANRHPGPTVNPHNPAHTPGGSSSGSAAAVADFMVPLGFGTQTAGSVIRPAAYCGVVGYKPSFNEVSRVGVKLQSGTLDTVGVMARALDDLPLIRAVLLALPPVAIQRDSAAPRIGFCRSVSWPALAPDCQALLERTAAKLSARGATVKEVALPPEFDEILAAQRRIMVFEAARNFAYERTRFADRLSPELRDVLAEGLACPLADYVAALEQGERLRDHLDGLLGSEFDGLLTPSALGEAPAGLGATGDPQCNSIGTLAGTPCVSLPAGSGRNGLPLGIQLVGARFADERLLDVAAWVQARLD
jgi:Asp-tRNA(Asn)/Glu-tRNA(Gln) amidotransferase A subunit family amidase